MKDFLTMFLLIFFIFLLLCVLLGVGGLLVLSIDQAMIDLGMYN